MKKQGTYTSTMLSGALQCWDGYDIKNVIVLGLY